MKLYQLWNSLKLKKMKKTKKFNKQSKKERGKKLYKLKTNYYSKILKLQMIATLMK